MSIPLERGNESDCFFYEVYEAPGRCRQSSPLASRDLEHNIIGWRHPRPPGNEDTKTAPWPLGLPGRSQRPG